MFRNVDVTGMPGVEAQFDLANLEFGVQVAPFWNYFDGHDILVKRSKHAPDREGGWAIATAAATKIGNAYDWQFILELIRKRLMFGEDVWLEDQTGAVSSNAFVCSSLYSTAHAYATDVTISDKLNGLFDKASLIAQLFGKLEQNQFISTPQEALLR